MRKPKREQDKLSRSLNVKKSKIDSLYSQIINKVDSVKTDSNTTSTRAINNLRSNLIKSKTKFDYVYPIVLKMVDLGDWEGYSDLHTLIHLIGTDYNQKNLIPDSLVKKIEQLEKLLPDIQEMYDFLSRFNVNSFSKISHMRDSIYAEYFVIDSLLNKQHIPVDYSKMLKFFLNTNLIKPHRFNYLNYISRSDTVLSNTMDNFLNPDTYKIDTTYYLLHYEKLIPIKGGFNPVIILRNDTFGPVKSDTPILKYK